MSHGIGAQKTETSADGFVAGGTQREPSMEEILASIRRIIEDNDTPSASGVAQSVSESPQPEAPTRESPAHADPVREAPLADIPAAVVQAAKVQADERVADALQQPREQASARVERLPVGLRPVLHETRGEIEHFRAELNPENQPLRAERSDEPARQSARLNDEDDAFSRNEPDQAMQVDPVVHEPEEPRQSILSEYTGRKVAAAFGELNEVFEANRKRSFDQAAEEMLRPMLQDWLDNNLPTLVERLVREEIERVARGG